MSAVRELGYVPNSAARSLVTRRTDRVALVVSDSPSGARADDPWFSTVVRAAGRELEAAGKQVVLRLAGSAESRRGIERDAAAGHVDGVVLVPMFDADPLPAALAGAGVPVASIGRPAATASTPYVDIDHAGGAAAAVAHLLERRRSRIGAIRGPLDMPSARDRLTGYLDALRAAGLRPNVALGALTPASGAVAARELLDDDPHLDAIFVADDLMAMGALAALHEAGRRVPGDVAVVGFGDIEAAAYTVPALTTVRGRMADLAATAVRLLLAHLDGEPVSSRILPADLVVRASS
ncbi:LacI family DNA-binding transcriptional regulator [Thermocatellispora tengchongensis]